MKKMLVATMPIYLMILSGCDDGKSQTQNRSVTYKEASALEDKVDANNHKIHKCANDNSTYESFRSCLRWGFNRFKIPYIETLSARI